MTPEELPTFIQAFNRLAVSLPSRREEDADPQVQAGRYTTYFAALSDLPLAAVVNSLIELQRRGSGFFPSTQEWHRAAEGLLDRQVRAALAPAREEPWHHECARCEDTGWEYLPACTAEHRCGRAGCAQQPSTYTHTHVTACACRATNQTYQRQQDRSRLRARERRGAAKERR